MSGSVPGGGAKAEPNLTPILDMVFQLITFFMLVINFKAAELDLSLQLPVLGSAKPLPETAEDMKILVLNVQICHQVPASAAATPMATLQRVVDERPRRSRLQVEVRARARNEPCPQGAITNGKTCLSIYGRLLCKESRGKDIPSIDEYLRRRPS